LQNLVVQRYAVQVQVQMLTLGIFEGDRLSAGSKVRSIGIR
jgi:hypothetical protein